jgi:hypothetical protein
MEVKMVKKIIVLITAFLMHFAGLWTFSFIPMYRNDGLLDCVTQGKPSLPFRDPIGYYHLLTKQKKRIGYVVNKNTPPDEIEIIKKLVKHKYSGIIKCEKPELFFITTGLSSYIHYVIRDEYSIGKLYRMSNGFLDGTTLIDFIEKNKQITSLDLSDLEDELINLYSKDMNNKVNPHLISDEFRIHVSRIGFNREMKEALIWIEHHYHRNGSGRYYILRKENSKWIILNEKFGPSIHW